MLLYGCATPFLKKNESLDKKWKRFKYKKVKDFHGRTGTVCGFDANNLIMRAESGKVGMNFMADQIVKGWISNKYPNLGFGYASITPNSLIEEIDA